MEIRVRFFASLRDAAGRAEQRLELPAGATPQTAWEALCAERPELAPRRASLAAAVNRRYGPFDAPLADGDELAFLPPVSGG